MRCAWSINGILSYGKSTVFFLAPLITSTVGRGGGGGVAFVALGKALVSRAGRGVKRRVEVGAGFADESFEPTPGSGTSMARSPSSNVFLLAPEVCSSAWSTELRITS